MEAPMNYIRLLVFVFILMGIFEVDVANECGKMTIQRAAWKLGPCEWASKASNTPVSGQCCSVVRSMIQNTGCLCAVALSETASKVGVRPQIALSIAKRCNISNRPVGAKWGAYTWP